MTKTTDETRFKCNDDGLLNIEGIGLKPFKHYPGNKIRISYATDVELLGIVKAFMNHKLLVTGLYVFIEKT